MDDSIDAKRREIVRRVKQKKKRPKHTALYFFLSFFATLFGIFCIGLFIMYGPFDYVRNLWVTTAMGTGQHQWLATMLFDQKDINAILNSNKVVEPSSNTNPNAIKVTGKVKDNATTLPTEYNSEHIIDGVGFIKIRSDGGLGHVYKGWVVKIYDPSRVYMALSNKFGDSGERISHMVQRTGAYVGINAGGFEDPGGEGNGGTPNALLISNFKIEHPLQSNTSIHSIIGLDSQNRLTLQKLSTSQATQSRGLKGLKTAVEWSPFLIMDGQLSSMTAYSGGAPQPRTAIGQTQSGVLIFLIIDGRRPGVSDGATFRDLQQLMVKYGAYEATTLDGGSSSVLVYNDGSTSQVLNNPSSADGERYLPNAFLITK
ncbi:MAG: phosphodiester glycosidase family protein [Ethanoligenens sp.]|uniref:phosphodiester glycosidase family protein n=1 Tax=Ethanoligenens sp. TaxID=2099655 RepID=UPI0039EBAA26